MVIGFAINSTWCPETFTAASVKDIAATACPDFPLTAGTGAIATKMNKAVADFILKSKVETRPSQAESWNLAIAEAMKACRKTLGPRPTATALRIGIDPDEIRGFLQTAFDIEQKALYASSAAGSQKAPGRPARASVDALIAELAEIFAMCFGRESGVSSDIHGTLGGPSPRFIAESMKLLLAGTTLPPDAAAALKNLQSPATVARNMKSQREKRRIAGK
jgi:hypothetical protein